MSTVGTAARSAAARPEAVIRMAGCYPKAPHFGYLRCGSATVSRAVQSETGTGQLWTYSKAMRLHGRIGTIPGNARRFAVPAEYLSLHKYLDGRFAQTVVLTFGEMEDLLGFPLPDMAHQQAEWWANPEPDGTASAHSRCWTEANRTATPNLVAHHVTFERAAG